MCVCKCGAWCKSVGFLQGLVLLDEHQALQWAEEGSSLHPEDARVKMEAELQHSRTLQGCECLGLNAIFLLNLESECVGFSLDDVLDKIK